MMMIISGRHANNSLRTPNPNPPYKEKDKNNQITRPLFPPNFPTFVLFFKFGAQSKKSWSFRDISILPYKGIGQPKK
jgi:hypothetical protein